MANRRGMSPSRLEAAESCPCFSYPEGDSEAALEGTALHAAAETGDLSGLDEEQFDSVTLAINYRESVLAAMPGAEQHKEIKLRIEDLVSGTADFVAVLGTKADLMDYKFGRKGATDAKDNLQVQAYVAGVFERWPDVQEVTGHIVAPRVGVTNCHTFKRTDVQAIRERIIKVLAAYDDPFKQPKAAEDLCGICKWAAKCPALCTTAMVVARKVGLPVPEAFAPEAMVSTRDRAIGQIVAVALENWAEQVKKANTEFVKAGGEIPGFKLVERSTGVRVVPDAILAAVRQLKASGLGEEEIWQAASLSFPKLAALVHEKDGVKDEMAREQLRGILADCITEGRCSFLQKAKGGGVMKELVA